ncbi:MAG TPA: hypothetical protein VFV05_18995 [Methylomirabilota bacterium]|nr:hypothetical protein [Methylomirabilota bacterium]
MQRLKTVMRVQAIVLLAYGLPYFLAPGWALAVTQQPAVPENYILRSLGIAFIVLAGLELKIVGDLAGHRDLSLAYAVLPAAYCVTILLQLLTTGFNGAAWFWWLNVLVTGGFAVALFVARRQGR